MDKIAAVTKPTVCIMAERPTLFGLVLGVKIVILLELVGAVSKLAVALVRAVPILHVFPAQLRFFFVQQLIFWSVFRRIGFLGRKGAGLLLARSTVLPFLPEHSSAEHLIPIDNIYL